jgi:hypothetical protein
MTHDRIQASHPNNIERASEFQRQDQSVEKFKRGHPLFKRDHPGRKGASTRRVEGTPPGGIEEKWAGAPIHRRARQRRSWRPVMAKRSSGEMVGASQKNYKYVGDRTEWPRPTAYGARGDLRTSPPLHTKIAPRPRTPTRSFGAFAFRWLQKPTRRYRRAPATRGRQGPSP